MPILLILICFVGFTSIVNAQNTETKTYNFSQGMKNISIDGFDEIYFEFGDNNKIEIQYPKSVKNTRFKSNIKGKNASFSIKQKPHAQPKVIRIIGDLENIKTIDVNGNCKVYFPYGWEGGTLRRWQNHDQAEFYYDRN